MAAPELSLSPRATPEQRQAILTQDRALVVQAGAGTGKTWVLVQRFLALLENHPDWSLDSIVAVTFTEKAAREMRGRIRRAIEARAADRPDQPIWQSRRRELDQVLGLELGADDYITKPFDIDVLLAHIKAVLRRSAATPNTRAVKPTAVVAGDLTVDPAAHVARLRDRPLDLAPKEFDLLLYLAQSAGTALSVQDILHHVWGEDWIGEEQTVYVHVRWLRTKLEDDPSKPQRLLTVRGAGYKLMAVNA